MNVLSIVSANFGSYWKWKEDVIWLKFEVDVIMYYNLFSQ